LPRALALLGDLGGYGDIAETAADQLDAAFGQRTLAARTNWPISLRG
jgi:hypothetical protein